MSSASFVVNGYGSNGVAHSPNGAQAHLEPPYANGASTSNGYIPPPYQLHNEEIVNHLYHAGFQTGHVHQNAYRLHAIILSRSPYLAHLMSTSAQSGPGGQKIVQVHLEQEPEVTHEGFAIALGYLYSAISLGLINPENARGALAAGCLLGGMDDLCAYAYDVCKHSMNPHTISEWLKFPEPTPPTADADAPSTSVFGAYAERLRSEVFDYLVVTLPNLLEVQAAAPPDADAGPGGRDVLLQIFAGIPFDMFKAAVEAPTFQIGSDQARFKFAKDAIELRKQTRANGMAEETVVLAFGGGNFGGSAVHVTKKMKKRPLWKVNA
ncbi:hypothetical protein FIBSPDRAFT_910974 [Athelia psychrophila]|uniref:BTB domain-containing protein n=1 Tax=Athelia psychrophila TaxID=1759441 RepID=A0A166JEJ4_9AGAM|nr:hypothetical protein FIBSPDRAFT_910974 [Fibularhizoctonia sp. CBS 109695]